MTTTGAHPVLITGQSIIFQINCAFCPWGAVIRADSSIEGEAFLVSRLRAHLREMHGTTPERPQ